MEKISIKAKDGADITALSHNFGNGDIKGVVIIIHGFGEHAAMYTDAAERLGRAGYACLLYDQRGHGASPDGRKNWFGIIPSYQHFLEDLDCMANEAKKMAPNAPIALYGHSMGGNIVLNHLLSHDESVYNCAVLEAPWLGLYTKHNPFIIGLAKFLGSASPNAKTTNELKPELLTSDPEKVDNYTKDPLYHGQISFRLFTGVREGCENAINNASKITIPVFLSYAEQDKVLDNEPTLRFAENAGDNVKLHKYDCKHAIHNDLKSDEFFKDVIEFLDEHCRVG